MPKKPSGDTYITEFSATVP